MSQWRLLNALLIFNFNTAWHEARLLCRHHQESYRSSGHYQQILIASGIHVVWRINLESYRSSGHYQQILIASGIHVVLRINFTNKIINYNVGIFFRLLYIPLCRDASDARENAKCGTSIQSSITAVQSTEMMYHGVPPMQYIILMFTHVVNVESWLNNNSCNATTEGWNMVTCVIIYTHI